MAFGVKYRMEWIDQIGGSHAYKLDVLKDGYASTIINLGHAVDNAFVLNYSDEKWVSGCEGVFSFTVNEANTAAYDADFYDSFYKQLKIKFYIDGVLKNVGWIKPENTTREYLQGEFLYQISFTDGLNDLKDIDYSGYKTTGPQSVLQIIKNSLVFNGLDDLDFFVQCNLYEDILMTPGQSVFTQLQFTNAAFYDVDVGEPKADKCFDVLEKCVKSFYCRLSQVDGYWQIVNGQEYNSPRFIYAYSNLAVIDGNSGTHDRQVDIGTYYAPVESKWELTKIPPIKTLRTIWRNKNAGDNELTNGDFSNGVTGWTNGAGSEAWYQFQNFGGKLRVVTPDGFGDPNLEKSFKSDAFGIASIGDGTGFLKCEFELTLIGVEYQIGDYVSNPPYVRIRMHYPDASYQETNNIVILQGTSLYTSISFPLTQIGNYSLEVFYHPHSDADYQSIALEFDNIEVTQTATAGTSFDILYVNTSDAAGYLEEEEDVFFLDGLQISDVGVIRQGSNLTSSWTRYGFSTEGLTLVSLLAQQWLNDRQAFHDILTIELIDQTESLDYNSIVELDLKKYRFTEYSKNYSTKVISGIIQQVQNG